jgi:Heavy metal associated domain 2
MMPVFEYVHAINGRIRVKVPEVKRSLKFARRIEAWLGSFEGIHEVRANPVTGNVLILHDPERIAGREILAALIAAGYMGMGIATADEPVPEGTAAVLAAQVAELLCYQIIRVLAGFTPGPGWFQQLVETTARFVLRLVFGKVTAAMA